MRLLIGSSSPPDKGSGIGHYSKELTEELLRLGIEIHYLSPTPKDDSWIRRHSIRHLPSNQSDDPIEKARNVLHYINAHKFDGAINNDNSVLQSIAPGLPCPLVVVGHLDRTSVASLACFRSEWSDYVVTISYDMQRKYVQKYGVPITKSPIIYNGVKARNGGDYLIRRDTAVLKCIFAGGYTKRKGGDHILSAVSLEKDKWDGIELAWYGSIPDKIRNGLSPFPYVHCHGRVSREDFLAALRNSDVLLLPSRVEGCPMVMLEAMSFGVLPIASDGSGAMRWLINSGLDGFICHLKKWPDQMVGCLAYLRDNPKVLEKMKRAARTRYFSEFQITFTAKRILKLFERPTVDRHNRPGEFEVLRWHRPLRGDGKKAPFIDRLRIRFGILRSAGKLSIKY